MNKTNNRYSNELQNVLSYMVDILINEFPTDVFTPEYLMVAILDTKRCHANMILDSCLMSNNMEELKEIYTNFLKNHSKPLMNNDKSNKVEFDFELNKILNESETERIATGSNEIGTEHVLLAILSASNNIKIKEVLNTVGIGYEFILSKCQEVPKPTKKNKIMKPMGFINNNGGGIDALNTMMPMKGEVNKKAVSSKNEYINKYTTNINKLAKEGKIDKLIGRENETEKIIKILARRKKNNVILIGDGGVGKTAIVYNLATLIEEGNIPSILEGKEIVMIDIMSLVSGTHFRGMFEERVKGLFDELKASNKYILFIDDIQNVLKSSGKEKDTDISGMISEILSEGDVKVIATTSFKDYRNSVESNTSISRKLQKIIVEPSTKEETLKIINSNKKYYEDFHNVKYTDESIEKAIELSDRYITDRKLPDSAFDVIDLAGAYTCLIDKEPAEIISARKRMIKLNDEKNDALNNGEFEKIDALNAEENAINKRIAEYKRNKNSESDNCPIVINVNDIAKTVSDITNVPITKMNSNEKQKIAHIDEILKKSIIGQDEAVNAICRVIKRNKVGLGDKTKTMANILMAGPTGSGKTLIAKKLAEEIFGDEKALVRIDMSEYSEKNSVAKLTGAAPGYIGYENGGQLTEMIKNKQHCVLLLDEIEKADQEVYNLFLQLFDEGRLTDSSGQIVNFKNVIVLMTSNVGAKQASELGGGMGFNTNEVVNKKSIIEKALKQKFTPEFLNRIDKIVYFNTLTDENLRDIVKIEINKLDERLNELHYDLIYDDSVVEYIHVKALSQKDFGARPIIRLVQDNIEDKITDLMLENEYVDGYSFSATCENEKVIVS